MRPHGSACSEQVDVSVRRPVEPLGCAPISSHAGGFPRLALPAVAAATKPDVPIRAVTVSPLQSAMPWCSSTERTAAPNTASGSGCTTAATGRWVPGRRVSSIEGLGSKIRPLRFSRHPLEWPWCGPEAIAR
jgi:hypothetical protein